ncbi:hypothetical protein AXK60_04515 [Tsukamurella pseudospumae]|uniref:Uncharacterized protein n=2 Tax=Tsukamurella pseudospumae TaxID=239498 RepID=A0A138AXG3_9ACTN|nr:hypothetical protein AXK60_04515 [Tsukamurella pseudospumae]
MIMDRSGWWDSYLAGTLVVIVPALLVCGAFVWWKRGERLQFKPLDVVGGYGAGMVVSLVVVFAVDPQTPFGHAACNMLVVVVAMGIMVPLSYFRMRRWRRDDAAGRRAARAAIPAPAHAHFTSAAFQDQLAGITEAHPPTPETASDVIAYWVFRALDSGDYVDSSRLIHYATAIKGWRMDSPEFAATIPWLTAPFLSSGDKRWDPAVDRDFREHGSAMLTARCRPAVSA